MNNEIGSAKLGVAGFARTGITGFGEYAMPFKREGKFGFLVNVSSYYNTINSGAVTNSFNNVGAGGTNYVYYNLNEFKTTGYQVTTFMPGLYFTVSHKKLSIDFKLMAGLSLFNTPAGTYNIDYEGWYIYSQYDFITPMVTHYNATLHSAFAYGNEETFKYEITKHIGIIMQAGIMHTNQHATLLMAQQLMAGSQGAIVNYTNQQITLMQITGGISWRL